MEGEYMPGSRGDRMYEVNDKLDEIRTLFYTLLDFGEDALRDDRERARRELLFAVNDLRILAEQE